MLFWLLALSPLLTSCATWHSMLAGGSAGAPAVSVTPPPADTPAPVVLAATSTPSGAPAPPRPALAGDPYRDALADAYRSFKTLAEGKNADYIPILAKVNPALYGIVLVTVDGAVSTPPARSSTRSWRLILRRTCLPTRTTYTLPAIHW